MKYIIRHKQTGDVLYVAQGNRPLKEVNASELYAAFDAKSMEIGWTNWSILPRQFNIAEDGSLVADDSLEDQDRAKTPDIIRPLILKEQVARGIIQLNAPFEYIEDEQLKRRSPQEIADTDAIASLEEAERYLAFISDRISTEIGKAYPIGDELKLVKSYMAWLNEGKPANDKRELEYLEMQESVTAIKQKYADMKAYAKEKLASFPQQQLPSQLPTPKSTKAEIQAFLKAHQIPFSVNESKQQLLEKLKD